MARLLFVVSSATEMALADGTPHEIGYWPEEVYRPLHRYLEADVEVVVATPDGAAPTPDPLGLEPRFHYRDEDEDFLASVIRTFAVDPEDIRITLHHLTGLDLIAARSIQLAAGTAGVDPVDARSHIEAAARVAWFEDRNFVDALCDPQTGAAPSNFPGEAQLRAIAGDVQREASAEAERVRIELTTSDLLMNPRSLSGITNEELEGFDGVFFPGGHGPMVDLAANPDVDRLVRHFHERSQVVSAVCHGPAALLSVGTGYDGAWLLDGYRMTVFTNDEEDQVPVGQLGAPWYVETAVRNKGAVVDNAPNEWVSHVVVDRNVVTGQNPASSDAVADAVLKKLEVL